MLRLLVIHRAAAVNDKYKVIEKLQGTANIIVVKATEIEKKYAMSYYYDILLSIVKSVDSMLGVSFVVAFITRFMFNMAIKIDSFLGLLDIAAFLLALSTGLIADRMGVHSRSSRYSHQHTE